VGEVHEDDQWAWPPAVRDARRPVTGVAREPPGRWSPTFLDTCCARADLPSASACGADRRGGCRGRGIDPGWSRATTSGMLGARRAQPRRAGAAHLARGRGEGRPQRCRAARPASVWGPRARRRAGRARRQHADDL
jgi:hypothetical protein